MCQDMGPGDGLGRGDIHSRGAVCQVVSGRRHIEDAAREALTVYRGLQVDREEDMYKYYPYRIRGENTSEIIAPPVREDDPVTRLVTTLFYMANLHYNLESLQLEHSELWERWEKAVDEIDELKKQLGEHIEDGYGDPAHSPR